MKKITRRQFLAATAIAGSVSVLTGCGTTTDSSAAGVSSTATDGAASQPGEKAHFTMINRQWEDYPPDVDINDNPIVNVFDEKLPNMEIEWQLVPQANLNEKVNMLVNSGEYPDVLPCTVGEMVRWADMGIIQPLDDVIDGYDQIYNYMTDDEMKCVRYNGHTWAIISPNNSINNPRLPYLRQDWLDNLGLSQPKTIEELYDVLYAFTYNDPDGNGVDDTFGIAGVKNFDNLEAIFRAFNVTHRYSTGSRAWWSWIDDVAMPDFIRPEMKDALAFLQRLWADGIMDKDTLVINQTQLEEKYTQNKIGMMGFPQTGMCGRIIKNLKKENPDAEIYTWLPEAEGEKFKVTLTAPGLPTMHAISSQCDCPEAVIEFANWLITPNEDMEPYYQLNSDQIYFGGIDHGVKVVMDKYLAEMSVNDLTPEEVTERNIRLSYRWHNSTLHAMDSESVIEYAQAQVDGGSYHDSFSVDKAFVSKNHIYTAAQITGPIFAELFSEMETYWEEVMSSIIVGDSPIEAFDDFVKFFYDNRGQEIIDEITAMNA